MGGCVVAAAAVLLRVPFLHVPLTADEGGYAEVARLWAQGSRLYRGDWIDRPQGLLIAFRVLLAGGATTAVDMRLAAAAVGALLAVLVLVIGRFVLASRLAWVAAALATAACASPYIEGFTLAGELLAAVAAAGAIALLLMFRRRGRLTGLFVAGLLAGSALMLKQSAFDAAGTGLVLLAVGKGGRRIAAGSVFLSGVATPVVAAAVSSGNLAGWYHAVVGYDVHASLIALPLSSRLAALADASPRLLLALGPLLVFAGAGWSRANVLVRTWAAFALVGVCVGGAFHPHYFLQLVAPVALLAAGGIGRFGRRGWRGVAVTVAAPVAAVLAAAPLWFQSGTAQARTLWPGDRHLLTDAAVAGYVRRHTPASASIYVLWAAADVYYLADRRPALPYLWLRNVETIAGARAAADRVLAQRRASLVIEEQPPAIADASGRTATLLRDNYRSVAQVGTVVILARRAP